MNEEYIKDAIEKIVEIYSDIENDLLIEIASHFSLNEEFINSDFWRLKKLDEMSLLNNKTMNILSDLTNRSPKELKKAINNLGYKMLNYDYLKDEYENNHLQINPDILIKNRTIQNIIKTAYDETNDSLIRISNKISESVRASYLEVLEGSYLKISMGTHSYQEAIRSSINDLSNEGIITLTLNTTDERGRVTGIRNYDVEGTVRRDLLTSVRKLNNDISNDVANELNCEYLYLSEHLRCRPTHFDWQGTIIKKEDLAKVTGYGTGGGLGGPNCSHYFEPYFGDARGSDLKSISKANAEKQYNLSQHQRYLERGVRKWLRKANMYKAADDDEYFKKCNKKVKEWRLRTKEFTEKYNLKRDFTREYVKENIDKNFNKRYNEFLKTENVGKLDISKYTKDIKTTTNEVVLTNNRREHLKKHPEIEKYIPEISNILDDPDYIYQELDKEDTVWIVKKLDNNLKITIKLNTVKNKKEIEYKNSIIQMQILNEKRIKKYIEKNKIKEIFDKNKKK